LKDVAMSDNDASEQHDETLPDDLLAKLERLAEEQTAPRRLDTAAELCGSDAGLYSEHLRLYEFLDQLTSPIRQALHSTEALPVLPEYEELEEIGRGGMGIVYRSMHKKMQRVDAIKVIRPDRLTNVSPDVIRQMQQRFERELRLAAFVAHEHIVPVYQVGETDGCVWFSMQFVKGTTLHSLSRSGSLVPEHAARYLEKIARAVHTVHGHGILHGDIKPQNILIETETDRPLLSDFGVADFLVSDMLTAPTGVAGTPAYMAPELAEAAMRNAGSDEIAAIRSVSSDVYSLGATLWAALTGESPRSSLRLSDQSSAATTMGFAVAHQCSSQIPQELLRICEQAMAHDPSARQASAGEFADDLGTWLHRPRWNRFFPGLQHLLWMVVAPLLFANGAIVWLLERRDAVEPWIWLAIFFGYVPLFATFSASQQLNRSSESARRELWSIWSGHAVGSLACFICLRTMFHSDPHRVIEVFYPCWAVISSVAFFAKSGNFWPAYRWIGVGWSAIAVLLAIIPTVSPIAFGMFSALTCIIIAQGDREFRGA
jgi:serine/threonine protein kinase